MALHFRCLLYGIELGGGTWDNGFSFRYLPNILVTFALAKSVYHIYGFYFNLIVKVMDLVYKKTLGLSLFDFCSQQ